MLKKKISQLADDTSIILDGSEHSLLETLKTLRDFSKMSGLCINYTKTQTVWIGSKRYSNDVLIPNSEFNWKTTNFTLLGIHFDVDLQNIPKLNYDPKIVKIKSTLKQWEKRYLTPIGRITVIKTLVLPLLNHILMSVPNPSFAYCKELEKLFFSFVWSCSTHKIKKEVLFKNHEDGGLKMVNLKSFILSLKLFWIRSLISSNKGLSCFIPDFDLHKFTSCGIEYTKLLLNTIKNKFWIDVFQAWIELHNTGTESDITADACLFYNPVIHVGGKMFFKKVLYDNNIRHINDIIEEDGTLFNYEKFCAIYPNVKINFLDYASITHSIKTWIRKSSIDSKLKKLPNPFISTSIYNILKCKKSKFFYEILNKKPLSLDQHDGVNF